MKIYQANILFTPSPEKLEVLEHGYIVVDDDGNVVGTYATLPAEYQGSDVLNFGDR